MNKTSGMDQDHEQNQDHEQDQDQDQDQDQNQDQDQDQDPTNVKKNEHKHVLRLSPCWSVRITSGSVVLSPWYLSPRGKTHCCCTYRKHCAPPKKVRKCGWTTSPCYLACAHREFGGLY